MNKKPGLNRRLLLTGKVLPMLAVLTVAAAIPARASDCYGTCEAGCKGTCEGGCTGTCEGHCKGTCEGTSKF